MTIEVRKMGAHKQVHSSDEAGASARAVIDEHGYSLKITVTLNYNALPKERIAQAHKQIFDTIVSAISTADRLRDYHPPMFEI